MGFPALWTREIILIQRGVGEAGFGPYGETDVTAAEQLCIGKGVERYGSSAGIVRSSTSCEEYFRCAVGQ